MNHALIKVRLPLLGILIILAVGISACGESAAEPFTKVTITASKSPSQALVYIAVEKGYFEEEGLDVTIQGLASGKAALNSLIEGNADLASTGDIPITLAVLNGEPLKIITTIYFSDSELAVVARRDTGIAAPRDLKGRKIGVTKGTGGHFFLHALLIQHRMSADDVQVVYLKPPDLVSALIKGEIDAVSTWQPFISSSAAALGNDGITFPSERIHRETINIVGMQTFVESNPEEIRKVLSALKKAEQMVLDDEEEARKIIGDYLSLDQAVIRETWPSYNYGITLEQSLLITLENEARWAIANGLSSRTEVPNYLDNIYMEGLITVKPEAVTIIR